MYTELRVDVVVALPENHRSSTEIDPWEGKPLSDASH